MDGRFENILIAPVPVADTRRRDEIAELLATAFPGAYGDCSLSEADDCLSADRIAIMAVLDDELVGFVGAIMQYGTTGYELHPIVVKQQYRHQGIGARLIAALEQEVSARGGITVYLGSDDETGATSLSDCDLYDRTFARIEGIQNLHGHPYGFYRKMGYAIVGVIPDANGFGKPDIWMAKRVRQPQE